MRGEWKAAQAGPDWYDVFKLQSDLCASQGFSTLISFTATGDVGKCEMLCSIAGVACGPDGMPRAGISSQAAFGYGDLRVLCSWIHETLSDMYEMSDSLAGSDE